MLLIGEIRISEHGWEYTLQVNVLSTVLLAMRGSGGVVEGSRGALFPALEIVSNVSHYQGNFRVAAVDASILVAARVSRY